MARIRTLWPRPSPALGNMTLWEYDIVAPLYKCNMTDIMAGIGLAQLKRYPGLLEKRYKLVRLSEPMEIIICTAALDFAQALHSCRCEHAPHFRDEVSSIFFCLRLRFCFVSAAPSVPGPGYLHDN